MLVNEVLDSKAIALASEQAGSNSIAYLGLGLFPEMKKAGLDLKWIKTSTGLPVALKASNFDALPAIRTREGIKIEKSQMAFFRESMQIDEETAIEIDRVQDANDPYLASAIQSIYDDTNNLVEGAKVIPEIMRMQLLATTNGHPMIGITADNTTYAYDYDPNGEYAAKHYSKLATKKWDDASTSQPITDLNTAKKAMAKMGKVVKYALMNSTTFEYLCNSDQVKNNVLAQNQGVVEVTDDNVKNVIKARTGLTVIIYDKMYKDETGEHNFYPDNKVTLLPEGTLGKTVFGTTPEERSIRQNVNADISMVGTGIAVATKTDYGPPVLTSVTVSEIVLPSYEGMDSTFVIEVA